MVIYPIIESQSDFICFYGSFLSEELGINNGDSNEINYANVEIAFVLMYQFSQRRKFNTAWWASQHPGARDARASLCSVFTQEDLFAKSKALSKSVPWEPKPSFHSQSFRKSLDLKNNLKKRRILTWENYVVFGISFWFWFFWDSLFSLGWPWIDCAAKDDLKLLTFLPPPFKCWDYKPPLIYAVMWGGGSYPWHWAHQESACQQSYTLSPRLVLT